MFRLVTKRMLPTVYCMNFLPFTNFDKEDRITKNEEKALLSDASKTSTGFDRVVALFHFDEIYGFQKELTYIFTTTTLAALFGACYGGFQDGKIAYTKFMERNDAALYENMFEAKKKLQDRVTTGFARGAWRWGWRLALFSGVYSLSSTCLNAYRNKTSTTNYMAAGLITGVLYKANIGMRGVVVGGVMGLTLGTIFGGLTVFLLQISNKSIEDIHEWNYKIKLRRKEGVDKAWEKAAKEKHNELTLAHDERIQSLEDKEN